MLYRHTNSSCTSDRKRTRVLCMACETLPILQIYIDEVIFKIYHIPDEKIKVKVHANQQKSVPCIQTWNLNHKCFHNNTLNLEKNFRICVIPEHNKCKLSPIHIPILSPIYININLNKFLKLWWILKACILYR